MIYALSTSLIFLNRRICQHCASNSWLISIQVEGFKYKNPRYQAAARIHSPITILLYRMFDRAQAESRCAVGKPAGKHGIYFSCYQLDGTTACLRLILHLNKIKIV